VGGCVSFDAAFSGKKARREVDESSRIFLRAISLPRILPFRCVFKEIAAMYKLY